MNSDANIGAVHIIQAGTNIRDYDVGFVGPEERKLLEKKLLRKIDARMSILVIIYILNYVNFPVKVVWMRFRGFGIAAGNRGALRIDEKTH